MVYSLNKITQSNNLLKKSERKKKKINKFAQFKKIVATRSLNLV